MVVVALEDFWGEVVWGVAEALLLSSAAEKATEAAAAASSVLLTIVAEEGWWHGEVVCDEAVEGELVGGVGLLPVTPTHGLSSGGGSAHNKREMLVSMLAN